MSQTFTVEELGLSDPEILKAAIAQDRDLFFALAMAQELKKRDLFPIQDAQGFGPLFSDYGGVLRTPGVVVYAAEVSHVPTVFFPITDAADFVRKISLVVRTVHHDRVAPQRAQFERTAPRDAKGNIIRYRAITGKQKGERHG